MMVVEDWLPTLVKAAGRACTVFKYLYRILEIASSITTNMMVVEDWLPTLVEAAGRYLVTELCLVYTPLNNFSKSLALEASGRASYTRGGCR